MTYYTPDERELVYLLLPAREVPNQSVTVANAAARRLAQVGGTPYPGTICVIEPDFNLQRWDALEGDFEVITVDDWLWDLPSEDAKGPFVFAKKLSELVAHQRLYVAPQLVLGVDGRWIGPQPGEHADEWVARLRPLLYQQFLLDVEARVVAVDLEPFPARV